MNHPIRRRLNYALGYFWICLRFIRLHLPGLLLYKFFFSYFISSLFRNEFSTSPLTQLVDRSLMQNDDLLTRFRSLKIALAVPITARRSGVLMEGEMLFAYKNSLSNFGIHALVFDPASKISELEKARSLILHQITEAGVKILILQGDSKLHESDVFDETLVKELRKRGVAIVVDLVDCFITRAGQITVDFFTNKADFLVLHNSRLKIPRKFNDSSLLWPSLPYPENYFIERHAIAKHGLLIPGSQHRGRHLYVNFAYKHKLDFSDSVFSKSNNSAAEFSYDKYVKLLCQHSLIFTNGYRNRKESQVIGRVTEAMLSKSTLLYESGSDIDNFFLKYRDYVPISNLPDFAYKAKYLLDNPVEADKIASNALEKMQSSFSTTAFWLKILKAVS